MKNGDLNNCYNFWKEVHFHWPKFDVSFPGGFPFLTVFERSTFPKKKQAAKPVSCLELNFGPRVCTFERALSVLSRNLVSHEIFHVLTVTFWMLASFARGARNRFGDQVASRNGPKGQRQLTPKIFVFKDLVGTKGLSPRENLHRETGHSVDGDKSNEYSKQALHGSSFQGEDEEMGARKQMMGRSWTGKRTPKD